MKKLALLISLLGAACWLSGQHAVHPPAEDKDSSDISMNGMSHAYSLSLPMNRNGSGTSWQPDESPIYAFVAHRGKTMFMFHGSVFLRYNSQNFNHKGKLGNADEVGAPNWWMAMVQRPMGKNGLLVFNGMFSLDALTEGTNGYPLMFQTGETYQGRRLVNRQHPHDLFSGLTMGYSHRLNASMDLFGYLGYPGEPALGPTAFMHRVSTMNNPDAPLAHHWQDATHIAFGVGTLGFRYKIMKLEGSIFTGREPNENRYNFDRPRFDSYSWRFSINPHRTLAFQVSQGFLQSPEQLESGKNVLRTTASGSFTQPLSEGAFVATSLVYGMNRSESSSTHSLLLESNCQLRRIAVYGRYEFVQKPAEDLELPQFSDEVFNIQALTLGSNLRIATYFKTDLLVGVQGTMSATQAKLDPVFGKTPLSAEVYLNVRPTRWTMDDGKQHDHHHHKHHHMDAGS